MLEYRDIFGANRGDKCECGSTEFYVQEMIWNRWKDGNIDRCTDTEGSHSPSKCAECGRVFKGRTSDGKPIEE